MEENADRAAIFRALAQGLDLAQVRERFGLSQEVLLEIFQEVADYYGERQAGFWRLFCDGASRGNPGPAGAGAALFNPLGEIAAQLARYLGETTNNVAEYQALLLGLREAVRLGAKKLQIFADSELLVRQLNGQYRVKAPHLLPLWRLAKTELQNFEAYTVSHVPRAENSLADDLANQGIDQRPPPR
jgi:ribonuclease HI